MTATRHRLLDDDTITVGGKTLYRLEAVRDIPEHGIVAGTRGGEDHDGGGEGVSMNIRYEARKFCEERYWNPEDSPERFRILVAFAEKCVTAERERIRADIEAFPCPTNEEVWLEYGWRADQGSDNMLWYNEGRSDEFRHFWLAFMNKVRTDEPKGRMYFKIMIRPVIQEWIVGDEG